MQEFVTSLKSALENDQAVVFAVRCEVWYSGRAEAHLPAGDRVILIKPDKTLLIHQPAGQNPVNYMKEGSKHDVVYGKDVFLHSQNLSKKEFMEIRLLEVHFFNAQKLEDGQKIVLSGTEKDMADMLLQRPQLIEQGFKPLSREEHTKYGFIDVFGHDTNNTLVVVECKRYGADLAAVSQLRRYVEKVKKAKGVEAVRGILAAPKISKHAERMLGDFGFEFRAVKPPKFMRRYDGSQKNLDAF